ncbi:G-protein coupled receptor 151-like [Sceloporus undulatus]|uniref:G-protein coupled receptor 151-like n=1 Tax=Sceloporus undulatus TaxID=8520 RepID=UPI001C4B1810|nr:G-protein coupled receptor 151-like [Sceloporus undulatus]
MNSSRAPDGFQDAGIPTIGGGEGKWDHPMVLLVLLAGLSLASGLGNLLLATALGYQLGRGALVPGTAWLLNLAAGDLILALCGLLPPRAMLCKTSEWLLHAVLVAKSLTWVAVGRARVPHVWPSGQGPSIEGWRRGLGVAAGIWGAALLLALPHLIFTHLEEEEEEEEGGHSIGLHMPAQSCAFQGPISGFMEVFGTILYPLAAYLGPAGVAISCYWRALRCLLRKGRLAQPSRQPPSSRRATGTLLGLTLLFHATWLPAWVAWMWERSPGHRPSWVLGAIAKALLFIDGALRPVLWFVLSMKMVWRGDVGRRREDEVGTQGPGTTKPEGTLLRDLNSGQPVEKMLPDVEHFWKERRNSPAGEESDPLPWEHQSDP